MTDYIFTDRYEGLGIPRPSLRTMCRGHCEGTGVIPIFMSEGDNHNLRLTDENDPELVAAWRLAEVKEASDDGWHFVPCPSCKGTGHTKGVWPRIKQYGFFLSKKWEFARHYIFKLPYGTKTAKCVLEQRQISDQLFGVSGEVPNRKDILPYGDRLDVPNPWWWNRRVALRVVFGKGR